METLLIHQVQLRISKSMKDLIHGLEGRQELQWRALYAREEGKQARGEREKKCASKMCERGLPTSIKACLEMVEEGLQFLIKFGGRCSLNLFRDGRVCVEVEVERGLQAHH